MKVKSCSKHRGPSNYKEGTIHYTSLIDLHKNVDIWNQYMDKFNRDVDV